MDSEELRMMVYAALFAALTSVGAYISIPIGPVPIVLQNMFILLTGLMLGKKWGAISVCVYLISGAAGLPVFAGGVGGIGRFAGPTGGYLIGYLPAVYLIGWISEKGERRFWIEIAAMILGMLVVYGLGVAWLKQYTGKTWPQTLAIGMIPFLIGDAVKIAAAGCIAKAVRPLMVQREMILDEHP